MKCFHHNDMDGHSAGAVVSWFEKETNPNDFYEVDYVMDLTPMISEIKYGEKVYFVDYSFTEDTMWILLELIAKRCPVVWIDHHASSLNLIHDYPELNEIKGIREDGTSGALLAWQYFTNKKKKDAPMFLKLVSDYDCWQFNYGEKTNFFSLGISACESGALAEVWKTLFEEGENNHSTLNKICDNGKVISSYVKETNKYYTDKFAYESVIDGHKALVVNRKSNSAIFGDRYNDYPLVCVWVFNGEKFIYSLFSSKPEIDCSKIAESYGGGGHKGASGFSANELLFKRV